MERETKRARRVRPESESLEARRLLSGGKTELPNGTTINDQDLERYVLQRRNNVPVAQRAFSYRAPDGANVAIRVFGAGSLAGTNVGPDGALNLVYDGTNESSVIRARVVGRSEPVPLATLRDADLALGNFSGAGGNILRRVELPQFRLISGGQINLTAGVGVLSLDSIGAATEVHLRDIPGFNARPAPDAQSGTATGVTGIVTPTTGGSTFVINESGGAEFAIPDATEEVAPVETPSAGSSNTFSVRGITYNYATEPNGGRVLVSTSGVYIPGGNQVGQLQPGQPGPAPAPPGTIIQIDRVDGPTTPVTLAAAQIYGYDPTANALIRFDTGTGAVLQTINLGGTGSAATGLSLTRVNGRLLALVGGTASTIRAFDANTGATVGQFSTASLDNPATPGVVEFAQVDGIGSSDVRTAITDSSAGLTRLIDVGASLAAGSAVPLGNAYASQNGFELAGGTTGLPASNSFYEVGAANFNNFTPLDVELGMVRLANVGNALTEASRTAITAPASIVNVGPIGSATANPDEALGAYESYLALVTDSDGQTNTVTLYNPANLQRAAIRTLNYANRLTGLSESFHPELVDAALIDMQGATQSFRSRQVRGMVYNNTGNLNLIDIGQASNTVIVGLPVGHVDIARRDGVTILSSPRVVGMRGDVTVQTVRRGIGPLRLDD